MKGLDGRGRLTDNIIDKLQNYYGMTVRQNSGDLNAMKSAASLFHVASLPHMIIILIVHQDQMVGVYSNPIKQIILAHTNLDLVCLWMLSKL